MRAQPSLLHRGDSLTAAQRGLPHCCTEGTLLIQCVLMGPSAPCSVCQGEVFVLKNRMDDNWAWGTSQLSGNSGIIPLVIMEEVHGENHWYYGKVWFRPDVSKDRAIELLKTSKFQGGHFFAFCVPAVTNSSWCCTPHPSPAHPLPAPPPPPHSTLSPTPAHRRDCWYLHCSSLGQRLLNGSGYTEWGAALPH